MFKCIVLRMFYTENDARWNVSVPGRGIRSRDAPYSRSSRISTQGTSAAPALRKLTFTSLNQHSRLVRPFSSQGVTFRTFVTESWPALVIIQKSACKKGLHSLKYKSAAWEYILHWKYLIYTLPKFTQRTNSNSEIKI